MTTAKPAEEDAEDMNELESMSHSHPVTDKTSVEHLFASGEEALRFVNRQPAGTTFGVHIGRDAPVEGKPGRVFPCGNSTSLVISRRDARKLAKELLHPVIAAKGGRLSVNEITYAKGDKWVWF